MGGDCYTVSPMNGDTFMAERGEAPSGSEETPGTAARPDGQSAPPAEEAARPEQKVTYSMSPGLSGFLGSNRIGLAISSYQSGKFYRPERQWQAPGGRAVLPQGHGDLRAR